MEVQDDDVHFVRDIKEWRKSLLSSIAHHISNERVMQDKQAELGIWKHGDQLPYPMLSEMKVVDAESLTFPATIGKQTITFSIWVMTGEIRIGVQIPNSLVQTSLLQNRLSESYDGKPCHRINKKANDTLFDWIWKDREFATFTNMLEALTSRQHTAVIIDRMCQVTLHLYLAITNELIDSHRLVSSHGLIGTAKYEEYFVSFMDDQDTFRWTIEYQLNGVIKNLRKETKNDVPYWVAHLLLPSGARAHMIEEGTSVRNQDGGCFQVIALSKIPL